MKSKFLIPIMFIVLQGHFCWAQSTFQKIYGWDGNDICRTAVSIYGQGYLFGGYSDSWGNGTYDYLLMRTDLNGNVLWTKNYGTSSTVENCSFLANTSDSGFLMIGEKVSGTNRDAVITKIDNAGNVLWSQSIGGNNAEYATWAIETDHSYVFLGVTQSYGSGASDVFVASFTKAGTLKWAKAYGGGDFDSGSKIIEDINGNLFIAGGTHSYGNGHHDFFYMKIDSLGNLLGMKTYGLSREEGSFAMEKGNDGGYILAGYYTNPVNSDEEILIIKIADDGSLQWAKTYGGNQNECAHSIVANSSNTGYIIKGYTYSFGGGAGDVFIASIDNSGAINWFKTIGCSLEESVDFSHANQSGLVKTNDGCYIFADYTEGMGAVGSDMYIGKITESGETCGNVLQYWPTTGPLSLSSANQMPDVTTISSNAFTFFTPQNQDVRIKTLCQINGVHNYEDQDYFVVFPNPITDILYVKINQPSYHKEAKVKIYNIVGSLMFENMYPIDASGAITINLSSFDKGYYLLTLTIGTDIYTEKIIIQ